MTFENAAPTILNMEGRNEQTKNYHKMREQARVFYTQIIKINCPAFNNEPVYFTAGGFRHLVCKSNRKERQKNVQVAKFGLLKKVVFLISRTTTHQEYEERLLQGRLIQYWGFVAIINNFRIKVIVHQIGYGKKEFLSVIPAWKIYHYKDIKLISNVVGDSGDD